MISTLARWWRGKPKRIRGIILMVPPGCDQEAEIERIMKGSGYTNCIETEPKAGCRRFKLS